jgi:hypothetical protein
VEGKFAPDLLPFVREITFAVEDPDNARVHPEENLAEIKKSLTDYGQVKPVVFWRDADGRAVIKAGNGTIKAARALGWTKIAATEFLGTEDEAMGFALADNHAPELATWDASKRDSQMRRLGITWSPPKIEWKPTAATFSPAVPISPPITVVPSKAAPTPRGRRETSPDSTPGSENEAPACRVSYGDLWLLGEHKVMCVSPQDDKSIRLLCAGERPSLRYVTVPPDTKPAWWGPGSARLPPFSGFETLIRAMNGELAKVGLQPEEIVEVTRDRNAERWFLARGDWELIPRDAYEALQEHTEGRAFNHPYGALVEVTARLQKTADRNVEGMRIAFDTEEQGPVLVLGSPLPGALVAAERVGRRCFGALADPKACNEAIKFWEEQTKRQAEKA